MNALKTLIAAGLLAAPFAAQAEEIVRHTNPGSNFPIAQAVEVPPGYTTVYVSGTVPSKVSPDADPALPESWGDTKTQTISVLENIKKSLESKGLSLGDVVKMQVYLVAPEGAEAADFAGFMEGYSLYFGTEEQPNLPARSAMIVDALVNKNWLVEIEVTAARAPAN